MKKKAMKSYGEKDLPVRAEPGGLASTSLLLRPDFPIDNSSLNYSKQRLRFRSLHTLQRAEPRRRPRASRAPAVNIRDNTFGAPSTLTIVAPLIMAIIPGAVLVRHRLAPKPRVPHVSACRPTRNSGRSQ